MSETKFTVLDDKTTLVVERVFPASRERVWKAWTTPEVFVQWWGPKGWVTQVKKMDFKEGGQLHYGMKCEDPEQTDWYGKTSWGLSTYNEINPQDSFKYIDEFCDENAVVAPNMPAMDISMEFVKQDGSTKVISTSIFSSPAELEQVIEMGMQEGLTQTWDRLEEILTEK
ncbi:MAG: SRPBCC domain-containing protein [Acidimicrobiia bacterium]